MREYGMLPDLPWPALVALTPLVLLALGVVAVGHRFGLIAKPASVRVEWRKP